MLSKDSRPHQEQRKYWRREDESSCGHQNYKILVLNILRMLTIYKPNRSGVASLEIREFAGNLLKMPGPETISVSESRASLYAHSIVKPAEASTFLSSVVNLGVRTASFHPFPVRIRRWQRMLVVLVAADIVGFLESCARIEYYARETIIETGSVNIGAILFFIYNYFNADWPAIYLV